MHYLKYIIGLVVITLTCNACSEDIFTQIVEIDIPDHESGISIGADFLQTNNDVVRLQASKGIQEAGDLEDILGANVVLKQGNVILKSYAEDPNATFASDGYYLNLQDLELEAGVEYILEVEKDGFPNATSIQVMPELVEITNLEYVKEGYVDPDGFRTDKIGVTFRDPQGVENYYGIKATVHFDDGNGGEYSYNAYIYNDIDPLIESGVNQEIILSDGAIDGRDVTFDFSLGSTFGDFEPLVKITAELFSMTKDKYLYERSLSIYENSEFNPFVEPVIVHENVSGGHGLFSLSNVSSFVLDID